MTKHRASWKRYLFGRQTGRGCRRCQKGAVSPTTACVLSGALISLAVGVAAGMLWAPRSGRRTRESIASLGSEKLKGLRQGLAQKRGRLASMGRGIKESLCPAGEERRAAATEPGRG